LQPTETPIQGTVDPSYTKLREAFAGIFADGWEQGGAVAAVVDGKLVADLWGGFADAAGTRPWRRDTLVNIWSATKGVMAVAIAMLVERGKLAYDRPIADVWPGFGVNGKEAISLDLALSHQAGLNGLADADGLNGPMDLAGVYAWTPYVEALAAMAPLWSPGSRCVYHAFTYGHLAGEPLRRVDGRSAGRFVAEEIAGPLGVPIYIGLPEGEDHRVAELIEGPGASDWVTETLSGPYPQACRNPVVRATQPNDRAWRAAEIPGANGQSDARALAMMYGSLASGRSPLVSPAGLAEATRPRFDGVDACFQTPASYGAGFDLANACYGSRASKHSFGHTGWGGTFAFADPEARIGFAYVTNRMLGFDDGIDPRRQRLVEALYAAL
jgi:CubicO group peptidase (beta-lactamase class C family)